MRREGRRLCPAYQCSRAAADGDAPAGPIDHCGDYTVRNRKRYKRRQVFFPMPATRIAMEAGLEDEKTWLAPQVQVAHHVEGVLGLVAGSLFVASLLTMAQVR